MKGIQYNQLCLNPTHICVNGLHLFQMLFVCYISPERMLCPLDSSKVRFNFCISVVISHLLTQQNQFTKYRKRLFFELLIRMVCYFVFTGWARLIRSHSSARFSFELSGNSNYIIHCNSNYVQNFELEINSI